MSTGKPDQSGERSLTTTQARKTGLYPCDGIPRYVVKGQHNRITCPRLTYSEARDAILRDCHCPKNDQGGHTVNREAIKRLGILNNSYWAVARPFIIRKHQEGMMEKARAMAAQKAKEKQPHEITTE